MMNRSLWILIHNHNPQLPVRVAALDALAA
jgi:hypothetical protein